MKPSKHEAKAVADAHKEHHHDGQKEYMHGRMHSEKHGEIHSEEDKGPQSSGIEVGEED